MKVRILIQIMYYLKHKISILIQKAGVHALMSLLKAPIVEASPNFDITFTRKYKIYTQNVHSFCLLIRCYTITYYTNGALTTVVTSPSLFISDPNPVIVKSPKKRQLDLGDEAVFTVEATGIGDLEYQWFKNGRLLPGMMIAVRKNVIFLSHLSHSHFWQSKETNSTINLQWTK